MSSQVVDPQGRFWELTKDPYGQGLGGQIAGTPRTCFRCETPEHWAWSTWWRWDAADYKMRAAIEAGDLLRLLIDGAPIEIYRPLADPPTSFVIESNLWDLSDFSPEDLALIYQAQMNAERQAMENATAVIVRALDMAAAVAKLRNSTEGST